MLAAILVLLAAVLLVSGSYVAAALMGAVAYLLLRRAPAEVEAPAEPEKSVVDNTVPPAGVPPLHRMTARFVTPKCSHPPQDADARIEEIQRERGAAPNWHAFHTSMRDALEDSLAKDMAFSRDPAIVPLGGPKACTHDETHEVFQ